jgi:hypothetical protein
MSSGGRDGAKCRKPGQRKSCRCFGNTQRQACPSKVISAGARSLITRTDRRPDFRPIHARAETISERRIFSEAYRKRRCIVPMNSFYLKDARRKRHAISRVDGDVFGVAGIWENWRNPGPTVLLGDNRTTYNCWERSRNLDNSGDRRQTAAPHTPSWSRRLILRFPCLLKTATDKSPPGVTAPAGFRTVEMRYIACPSSSATTPCRP